MGQTNYFYVAVSKLCPAILSPILALSTPCPTVFFLNIKNIWILFGYVSKHVGGVSVFRHTTPMLSHLSHFEVSRLHSLNCEFMSL